MICVCLSNMTKKAKKLLQFSCSVGHWLYYEKFLLNSIDLMKNLQLPPGWFNFLVFVFLSTVVFGQMIEKCVKIRSLIIFLLIPTLSLVSMNILVVLLCSELKKKSCKETEIIEKKRGFTITMGLWSRFWRTNAISCLELSVYRRCPKNFSRYFF